MSETRLNIADGRLCDTAFDSILRLLIDSTGRSLGGNQGQLDGNGDQQGSGTDMAPCTVSANGLKADVEEAE